MKSYNISVRTILILVAFIISFHSPQRVIASRFLVDFGDAAMPSPDVNADENGYFWNNLTTAYQGDNLPQLKDVSGKASSISLTITDSFWQDLSGASNILGTTNSALYSKSATMDSFFIGRLGGISDDTAGVTLRGLRSDAKYSIKLYASRMSDDLESDRTTIYTVQGVSKELQALNNIDGYVEFINLQPDNNALTIACSIKPGAIYGYLGVIEINEMDPPTVSLSVDSPTSLASATASSKVQLNATVASLDSTITRVDFYAGDNLLESLASSPWTYTWSNVTPGKYSLIAKATDSNGLSAQSDPQQITINAPPTANAGDDEVVTLPTNIITLKGSGTDTDGNIASYEWSQVSGPFAYIWSASNPTTEVSGLVEGTYHFHLIVKDNRGASGEDDVFVQVNPIPNVPPTADAGPDISIRLPLTTVSLTGSGTDSDGSIVSYQWVKLSDSSATISNPLSSTTSVSNLTQGTFPFRLIVTDDKGATSADDILVTVNEPFSPAKETLRPFGTVPGANYGYAEYLPEGYEQTNAWPLILFLHGIGEKTITNSLGESKNLIEMGKHGPLAYASPTRPNGNHPLPAIILCPQTSGNNWSTRGIEKFRKFAIQQYKIDPKRCYLTGLSMGGGGVYNYINYFPTNFAAAVPLCGTSYLNAIGASNAVYNDVPLWTAASQDDPQVKPKYHADITFSNLSTTFGSSNIFVRPELSTNVYRSVTAYFNVDSNQFIWANGQHAITNCPPYYYTLYSRGGHGVWSHMYNDPNMYIWLLNQRRP